MAPIKDSLLSIVEQNQLTCSFAFNQITQENSSLRLNSETASVGFIYRHVGEIMLMFGHFFGLPVTTPNTTLGQVDDGRKFNLEESHELIQKGYAMMNDLVKNTPEEEWNQAIETPFFGTSSKIKLFSHILFHTSHHAGQISLTLSRGK